MDCQHDPILVYLTNSRGQKMYCQLCRTCGATFNKWLKAPPPGIEGQPLDVDAQERGRRAASDARSAQYEADRLAKHHKYEAYILASPEWQRRRQLVLSRAHGVCEACLTAMATQVHHSTYDHLFNEILWELRAVCASCHATIHNQ